MAEYQYIVQTPQGQIERGRIVGIDPAEIKAQLVSNGSRLLGIETVRRAPLMDACRTLIEQLSVRRVRSSELELLLQQLAAMLASGLELSQALHELCGHGCSKRQRELCQELATAVEQGKPFATALEQTKVFPALVPQLSRVGEDTGQLAVTLAQAAEFMESRRRTTGNLAAALAYPTLVAIAAIAVAVYLVGWAIPQLAQFLHALGRELPWMTQSLLDLSVTVQLHGPRIGAGVMFSLVAGVLCYAWQPGRYRIDQCLLRVPVIGSLIQIAATYQLASSLALMLRSGVFLPDALRTAATLNRNQFLAAQVLQARDKIAQGKELSHAFGQRGFGPMLTSMVVVGQRTGDLPAALQHVAEFYAAQVDRRLQQLSKMIEPVIIATVGCVVGYVYVAFFMALMSAGGSIN